MDITFVGKHTNVPKGFKEYAKEKIERLERHIPKATAAQVELVLEKTKSADHRAVVQVTINANGSVIRAQRRSSDYNPAFDAVIASLERQAARFKDRLYRRNERRSKASEALAPEPAQESPEGIVRRKRFLMKPMSEEEAVEEMEALGHTFYLFKNAETHRHNVVYKRESGDYGLIDPDEL